jgi:Gas vesicle synthesis protein GvpL/GvpF
MPVLAYCITETQPEIVVPQAGVRGAAIEIVRVEDLQCFASQFDPQDVVGKAPIQEAALDFNRVLQDLLQQVAIIPFRFPTILTDETALSQFLTEHRTGYREALLRLRNCVQMEILLKMQTTGNSQASSPKSGAEYLRGRHAQHQYAENIVARFREAAEPLVKQWRHRETAAGIRCFALVDRSDAPAFLRQTKRVSVPSESEPRVTGPWPASEFLKEQ